MYTRAQALLSFDGFPINTEEEKINIFNNIPANNIKELTNVLENSAFGIYEEREFICNFCGKQERRSLHHALNPLELLPIENNKGTNTTGKSKKHRASNIFLGA